MQSSKLDIFIISLMYQLYGRSEQFFRFMSVLISTEKKFAVIVPVNFTAFLYMLHQASTGFLLSGNREL